MAKSFANNSTYPKTPVPEKTCIFQLIMPNTPVQKRNLKTVKAIGPERKISKNQNKQKDRVSQSVMKQTEKQAPITEKHQHKKSAVEILRSIEDLESKETDRRNRKRG